MFSLACTHFNSRNQPVKFENETFLGINFTGLWWQKMGIFKEPLAKNCISDYVSPTAWFILMLALKYCTINNLLLFFSAKLSLHTIFVTLFKQIFYKNLFCNELLIGMKKHYSYSYNDYIMMEEKIKTKVLS